MSSVLYMLYLYYVCDITREVKQRGECMRSEVGGVQILRCKFRNTVYGQQLKPWNPMTILCEN